MHSSLDDLPLQHAQIGCISGKVEVVRSRSYEEAYALMHGKTSDWYFCRGYFMQASNSFKYYTDSELGGCAWHVAGLQALCQLHHTPLLRAVNPESGRQSDCQAGGLSLAGQCAALTDSCYSRHVPWTGIRHWRARTTDRHVPPADVHIEFILEHMPPSACRRAIHYPP